MTRKIGMVFIALAAWTMGVGLLHAESGSNLKWQPSIGMVTGYEVCYGTSKASFPDCVDVGNVLEYPFAELPLYKGKTYYLAVRAYNGLTGKGGFSDPLAYRPETGAVEAPTQTETPPATPAEAPVSGSESIDTGALLQPMPLDSVVAEVKDGNITLKWSPPDESPVAGYRVYTGTSSRIYGLPVTVVETSYPVPDVEPDTMYYFSVTAVDAQGKEGGYSYPEISAMTMAGDYKVEELHPDGTVKSEWSVKGAETNHGAIDEAHAQATHSDKVQSLYGAHTDQYTLSDSSMGEGDVASRIEVNLYGYRTGSGGSYPGLVNVGLDMGNRRFNAVEGPREMPLEQAAWISYTFNGEWTREEIDNARLELVGGDNGQSNYDVVAAMSVRVYYKN